MIATARIVLDLGTTWVWTRPPVGIVRTEREFATHLLATRGLPVAFCRFDKVLGRHVEIDRDRVRTLLGLDVPRDEIAAAMTANGPAPELPTSGAAVPAGQVAAAAHQASFAAPPKIPLRERTRAALKRSAYAFLHRVPEPLRQDAKMTLKAGYQFARGSVDLARNWRRLARDRRRQALSAAIAPPSAPPSAVAAPAADDFAFQPGDVYLSMGLDWVYNDVVRLHQERRRVGFRTILFCYDTIPVRFPHLLSFDARQMFARYFVDVGHTADRVVAISETSKRDFLALMEEVGGPLPPVDVVLLGTDLRAAAGNVRPPAADLETLPFVLCVSTIEARKNHEVLYNAWDRLVAKHGDAAPALVIVGMVGWGVNDLMFRMRTNPQLKRKIRILDNLPDAELAWLYRNCLFTVFPSLYEGWGLPVVESLALGKPCICSTAPAVTEAAQGMATALDPLDTPAWTQAIETLWLDAEMRASAARRCADRFVPQTWVRHAEELLRIAVRGNGA